MKKVPVCLSLSFLLLSCCQNSVYMVFDKDIPDLTPKIFAEEIFSRDSSYVGTCTFNKEEKEIY